MFEGNLLSRLLTWYYIPYQFRWAPKEEWWTMIRFCGVLRYQSHVARLISHIAFSIETVNWQSLSVNFNLSSISFSFLSQKYLKRSSVLDPHSIVSITHLRWCDIYRSSWCRCPHRCSYNITCLMGSSQDISCVPWTSRIYEEERPRNVWSCTWRSRNPQLLHLCRTPHGIEYEAVCSH